MDYDCGLLTEQPILARLKVQDWPRLSDDVRHHLDVALLTPGFTDAWWSRTLGRSVIGVRAWRKNIDPDLRPEAIANWNSITRDDCLKLAQFPGHKPVPVIIQIISDIRNGMRIVDASKAYSMKIPTIDQFLRRGTLPTHTLPDWFKDRIPGM